ncbi:MAG: PAS domain-containing protein [Arthrospira sp. SH-MAG29]|nr:PAS domain-containing protein [Arthrospira sp. SH-MAG29]MBS0017900.1 PAS domain-containing protein [Arthrospira sp. SH-MAG29]
MNPQILARSDQLTRATHRENLLFKIANQMVDLSNLNRIFDTVVTELSEFLQSDRALICPLEPDGSLQIRAASFRDIRWFVSDENIAPIFWKYQAFIDEVMAIADIYQTHLGDDYIEFLARLQVRAILIVPIWVSGDIWGYLIVHQCSDSRKWLPEEVDLLKIISVHLAIAIQQANLLEKSQTLNTHVLNPQYSEVSFRALLANLPGAIYRCDCDEDWTMKFISHAIEDICGYRPDEIINNRVISYNNIIHPDDQKTVATEILQAVAVHESFIVEYRIIHRDGSIRWVYEKGRGKFDEQGNLLGLDGAIFDITERQNTELALQQKTQELDDFFSIALDLLCIADLEGRFLRLNQQWEITLGYLIEELEGRFFIEFVHPDDVQTTLDKISDLSEQNSVLNFVNRYQAKDGSYRWIEWRSTPVGDRIYAAARDITDRKKAEIALQESEQRWQFALEGNGDGVWDWNAQTNQVYFSRRCQQLLGFRDEEISDNIEEWKKRIHPDDKPQVFEALNQHLNGETEQYISEHRIQCKDGSYKWILDRGRVMYRSPDGKPLRVIGTHTDISDRKKTELALKESEEKFRQLAENIHQVFFINSAIGEMLYVSPAYEQIWQQSRDSLYKNPSLWLMCVHPEDRDAMTEALNKQISQGIAFDETYRIVRPDGSIRWIESRAFPVRDKQGNIYRYTGIAEDITHRKTIENALQNQLQKTLIIQRITEEIRQSLDVQEIFTTAVEQIGKAFKVNCCLIHTYQKYPLPHGSLVAKYSQHPCHLLGDLKEVVTFDNDPYIEYLVEQDRAISSHKKDCLIKISELNITSPFLQTHQYFEESENLKSMLAIATFYHGQPNGIISLHQCDHKRVWTVDEMELIEAIARQLGIAIAHAQLLSQEKEQRQELTYKNIRLKKMTEEAKAANRAKSEFLANMSHEIRTPMNAVLGFADLLQSTITDPQASSYIKAIASSGRTLLALINDILDLSKIEAGKLQLYYEPVNIRTIINEIEHIFEQKVKEKNIKLQVYIAPEIPYSIIMDEVRLRQILFNIVGNSIKFTEFGSVKIMACCSEVKQNYSYNSIYLKIAIADTGIGISPEDQHKIFDSFTQSEGQSNRKYGGTGLGLTITERLVHLLGGSIHLESQPNQGSTFTFDFPDVKIGIETAPSSPIIALDENLGQFEPASILVADDVRSNLDLLAEYFANTYHKIISAKDGQEAIRLAQIYQPDIIFMDLRMPRMDGREATQFLKHNELTSHIPIVLLTASPQHRNEQDLQQLCDGFLSKPVTKAQIVAELKKFLNSTQFTEPTDKQPSYQVSLKPVRLPELAAKLRQEVEVTLPHLRETLVSREIKQFIQNLEVLAQEHQSTVLLDYVATLKQQLQDFDWDNIPKTVAKFAEIPEQLIMENYH